jgi:hypothetical protein
MKGGKLIADSRDVAATFGKTTQARPSRHPRANRQG